MAGNYDEHLAYGEDYSASRGSGQQADDRGILGDIGKKLKSKYDQYQSQGQGQQYGGHGTGGYQYGSQPGTTPAGGQYGSQPPTSQGGQYAPTQHSQSSSYVPDGQGSLQPGYVPPYAQENPNYAGRKPDLVSKVFDGLTGTFQSIGSDVAGLLGGQKLDLPNKPVHMSKAKISKSWRPLDAQYPMWHPSFGIHKLTKGIQYQPQPYGPHNEHTTSQSDPRNRYASFATDKPGNNAKWYVDGCGYMWAVSRALEGAKESIWILDWWLSPELYLRRPPSFNEQYRLDRMLQSAAQRGVKVNVIVYKEVTQVLTRKFGNGLTDYLHSFLPSSTDTTTSTLVKMGLHAATASLSHVEREYPLIDPAVTVSSAYTKHTLEALHPNISVFRHPDHLPDPTTISSTFTTSFANLKLDPAGVTKFGKDQLDAVFGRQWDGNVLFWAHHEKLCLIDRKIAFMGGLDLCFGRWDTNSHPLSDVHSNIATAVFPGQDYNNARIMDFNDVSKPFENKLDRTQSSRMGWSDISCSLEGVVVQDLMKHFTDRWNFIFDEKYNVRRDVRYSRLSMLAPQGRPGSPYVQGQQGSNQQGTAYNQSAPHINVQETQQPGAQAGQFGPPPGSLPYAPPAWQSTSRPHTPSYESQQTSHGTSPSPQIATYQQPPAYQANQQFYPPPPPGGPPSLSPQPQYVQQQSQPTQEYTGNQYVAPPSNVAELGPVNYRATQPQTSRGLDDDTNPAYYDQDYQSERGLHGKLDQYRGEGQRFSSELRNIGNQLGGHLQNRVQNVQGTFLGGTDRYGRPLSQLRGGNMSCQIVRSCTLWSNGTQTEHSIQDAYIDIIRKSQHFIYIENQFFITKSNDYTSFDNPVKNQVGRAIVDRILQAARAGEQYKVIVLIPSVPGFAGDLRAESSLGTRAIMELQYNSICRGGNSIFDLVAKAGYNPQDYIRFYNLRNYDRINVSRAVQQVEQQSGVQYEDARRQHDDMVGAGFGGYGEGTRASSTVAGPQYQQYQQTAMKPGAAGSGRWDSVSECYMLNGTDIRSVPWDAAPEAEIDAFVSEELYIHSKILIADDRIALIGSANLNDRSQLGTHDSEIAIIINDPTPVQSTMAGKAYQASAFATSLRRQLFRKHLGLIKPQDMTRPDANFEPVGVSNTYDWGSPEDLVVSDPLSPTFDALWNSRARTNTEIFRKVFRCVPDDSVTTWEEYKEFFEYFFQGAGSVADGDKAAQGKTPPKYGWGHVVREDFPDGPEGIRQVKELLSQVKGTLVEMPLMFLAAEDIAKEGLKLNPMTVEVYT